MCNKFIPYLDATAITVENNKQIFVNCTDIMTEFVTVFENFEKDKKEVLNKIKTSADNVDGETQDKFTHVVKHMEIALKHMNYFNKKKDEILKTTYVENKTVIPETEINEFSNLEKEMNEYVEFLQTNMV